MTMIVWPLDNNLSERIARMEREEAADAEKAAVPKRKHKSKGCKKKAKTRPKAQKKSLNEDGSKKRKKRGKETFKTHIYKVMKEWNSDLGISSLAMGIMNSFINDSFEKLAQEAGRLAQFNKKQTIGPREIESAVNLVLRGELARSAVKEGKIALDMFNNRARHEELRSKSS